MGGLSEEEIVRIFKVEAEDINTDFTIDDIDSVHLSKKKSIYHIFPGLKYKAEKHIFYDKNTIVNSTIYVQAVVFSKLRKILRPCKALQGNYFIIDY